VASYEVEVEVLHNTTICNNCLHRRWTSNVINRLVDVFPDGFSYCPVKKRVAKT